MHYWAVMYHLLPADPGAIEAYPQSTWLGRLICPNEIPEEPNNRFHLRVHNMSLVQLLPSLLPFLLRNETERVSVEGSHLLY